MTRRCNAKEGLGLHSSRPSEGARAPPRERSPSPSIIIVGVLCLSCQSLTQVRVKPDTRAAHGRRLQGFDLGFIQPGYVPRVLFRPGFIQPGILSAGFHSAGFSFTRVSFSRVFSQPGFHKVNSGFAFSLGRHGHAPRLTEGSLLPGLDFTVSSKLMLIAFSMSCFSNAVTSMCSCRCLPALPT